VRCWGNNRLGQLGDGTFGAATGTPVPTSVIPESAVQLALGSTHSCVRTTSRVYYWGDNGSGQVGVDNGTAMGFMIGAPTRITSLGAVDELVGGTNHTCARDGTRFRCFGDNTRGQLGDGTSGGNDFMPRTVRWL